MIGNLIGRFLGRKIKEKAVDAVLDKVDLPDPVEAAIKTAATGNIGDLLAGAADAVKETTAKKPARKK